MCPREERPQCPITFQKYTLNKDGACFGWKSSNNQISSFLMPQVTSVKNLYLAGHWCTIGTGQGGVPKSIFSGRAVSNIILKSMRKEWRYSKNYL